jgi:hypothetical protein
MNSRRIACSFERKRLGPNVGGKSPIHLEVARDDALQGYCLSKSSLVNKAVKKRKRKKLRLVARTLSTSTSVRMRERRLALKIQ